MAPVVQHDNPLLLRHLFAQACWYSHFPHHILGGIMGNIFFMLSAFFWFFASPFSIVIGASGAIFALGGTLAVLTPKLRVFVFPIPVPMPLWVAVIGGFVILSFIGGVAWQGHLGGLVLGLIAGFILRKRVRTPIP
jgi:membrane associated rhomboid family serine protease